MDGGVSSAVFNTLHDDKVILPDTEVEVAEDIKKLDKEADEELVNAFDGISDAENDSTSEDDSEPEDYEDQERNVLADGSIESEGDESTSLSAGNHSLHRRDYNEYENRWGRDDSCSKTDESSVNKPSISALSSHAYGESVGSLTTGQSSQYSVRPNSPNGNVSVSDANDHIELNSKAPLVSALSSVSTGSNQYDLKEEYQKLYIIYEANYQELVQLKSEETNYKMKTDSFIKNLELELDLVKNEKSKLASNLQDSQNLISDFEQEKNNLLGEVNALKSQLSSMSKIKHEIQNKLESSEVTIQSLEKQLNELNRTDNLSRLHDQHNRILEEMKLRHKKDILSYKENIDMLQSKLNSKLEEAKNLALENSELLRKYEQLQIDKAEQINKMHEEVELAQKKYQIFLESGTIEESQRLKLQFQHLGEEKSNIERENSLLRDEIKSLKAELETNEALQRYAFSKGKMEASARGSKDLNLQQELESSLKNVRSLRSEKHALKQQLEETKTKLNHVSRNAELLESQYTESKKRVKELEEKLRSFTSNDSTKIQFYEKKIQELENELSNAKKSLYDASVNEKTLIQSNNVMQKKIMELIKEHTAAKIQAVNECQQKLLELHESTLQKEKEKILSKANAEIKDVCFKYENKISEMQKEIKDLNEGLYDSKNQYLTLYRENKSLQAELDEIKKPKDREDIEKNICLQYEQKLTEMKAQLIKHNKEYLAGVLKTELEKAEIEWANKKMAEIKKFIEETKQRLSDEFQNCLQKEQAELQKKLESEKERLHQEYEETKANLKRGFEEEKVKLTAIHNQDVQSKWDKNLSMLKERHENEVKYLKNQFDSKLLQLENEIKCLKHLLSVKADEKEEVEKLEQDFKLQQEKWQKEKDALAYAETLLNENLKSLTETEQKLREKLKKYQKHVAAVKKHYEGRITILQVELSDFKKSFNEKQNQLQSLQEKYDQEMLKLDFKKYDSTKSVVVQTEEELVPKSKILNLEDKFFKCLMNISDGIRHYVNESKRRNAERIQAALMHYHQQVSTKLLQDLSKDVQSFTPTIIFPRTSNQVETASKETFETSSIPQNPYNAKFKTSTPANLYSTDKHFEQAEKIPRHAALSEFSTIPNFNSQTSVKSIHTMPGLDDNQSRTVIPNSHNAALKTLRLDIFNTGDSLLTEKVSSDRGLINGFVNNHHKKDFESVDRFEDISYDFLTLNFPTGIFDSSKMNGHRSEQENYDKCANKCKDSFPVKLFPS